MGVRLLASVALIGGVSSIAASIPAHAAVIPDPVLSITVTPPNPQLFDLIRTDVQWCVPDSTSPGDTFEIALPPELIGLPRGFDLRDPAGELVATSAITGQPATATFTFTNYVDTHNNVCGTAFFESSLAAWLVPGTTYVLTYVVNHVTTFTPVITPRPYVAGSGRPTAVKNAYFEDPSDECRTAATGCIAWTIESRVGPFQSVTVDDTAAPGLAFECGTLTVLLWSVDASGALLNFFDPTSQGATVAATCSASALHVVGSNIPAGLLMRVLVRATPQVLDPAGGVTFVNSATVTHVSASTVVDNVSIQRRSALAGGDGSGVIPTTTTTTTVAPGVGAEAPTTTLAAATTTTVATAAAAGPVPPAFPSSGVAGLGGQLPATGGGANRTVLGAGVVSFLAGTLLMLLTTRRRRTV